mmetsp:Transcript_14173/g.30309  ORF Transcript_14173/g.30309 Transcript_14173/m.30309 type:complete len:377 (-) Transcript_14173:168-1298(-)|eukprot:CAMPEP_0118928676 /NCGR_PEP_ID=MMETSP1169-20130426/5872_1 /TAXON_ID=36882 /ORGANISM="Pyramimonas obovata, Strain CCMP722" /LENGTH=376 /DNA_ID=CAMNT_0006870713 /DNA_START=108 /DNA_END=1241 /DNA_ORIENTATION=-
MLRAKSYRYQDSNVADIGSAMDKAQREAAAKHEPAWDGVGKEVGVRVWRVEKFEIKAWPEQEYGNFFDGDAYIVLKTYKDKATDSLKWDIHFWLGADCSQDEAGTAAYKAVELDDSLGGAPVQHRQVMGFESASFLSLFSPSVTILSGGISSGFNHVQHKTDYKPRLMRIVQANRKISTFQVALSNRALNQGDVYILDKGLELLQWNGDSSSPFERNKAAQIVQAINAQRKGQCSVEVLGGEDPNEEFHGMLEGDRGDVLSKEAAEAADAEGKQPLAPGETATYRLSDESGKMECEKLGAASAFWSVKNGDDVMIVDNDTDIFVWVGSRASLKERQQSIIYAQRFLVDNGRPPYLPIHSMLEGHEGELFLSVVGKP